MSSPTSQVLPGPASELGHFLAKQVPIQCPGTVCPWASWRTVAWRRKVLNCSRSILKRNASPLAFELAGRSESPSAFTQAAQGHGLGWVFLGSWVYTCNIYAGSAMWLSLQGRHSGWGENLLLERL